MICPLYKQAWIQAWGKELIILLDDEDFCKAYDELLVCDRNNCALWVASEVDPEKYGHCGLRK